MMDPLPKTGEVWIPDGADLRELRLLSRMTLREVADEVGVNKDTIWRWEQGERSPRVCDATKLVEIYQDELDGQRQLARS